MYWFFSKIGNGFYKFYNTFFIDIYFIFYINLFYIILTIIKYDIRYKTIKLIEKYLKTWRPNFSRRVTINCLDFTSLMVEK